MTASTNGMKTIIYPVRDLDAAKALFTALLGTGPDVDAAYYVGWQSPELHVGLDPHGFDTGMTGPVPFWHVDDIEAGVAALTAAGAEVKAPAKDVGGGRLVATLADADGNAIGLVQG